MDNSQNKDYNIPNGISIIEMRDYMQTWVYTKNNLNYQYIFCYITENEFEKVAKKDGSVWLDKDYYDSLVEAKYQARLQKNTHNIRFMRLGVCMTGTVFDLLSSEDTEKLRKFYDSSQTKIDEIIASNKIRNKDDYVINQYCKSCNFGLVRNSKKQTSGKHVLKCINTRNIIIYNIKSTNIIDCYEFV